MLEKQNNNHIVAYYDNKTHFDLQLQFSILNKATFNIHSMVDIGM